MFLRKPYIFLGRGRAFVNPKKGFPKVPYGSLLLPFWGSLGIPGVPILCLWDPEGSLLTRELSVGTLVCQDAPSPKRALSLTIQVASNPFLG